MTMQTYFNMIEIEVENEQTEQFDMYLCTGVVKYSHDGNWGSDADGNRGESRIIIEDIEFDYIEDEDCEKIQVSEKLQDVLKDLILDRIQIDF